jgi:ATP-dependent DNA helicase RecQ
MEGKGWKNMQVQDWIQYKGQDYQKLSDFYDHKVQQIHIVGEYAKKMIDDYTGALKFVDDYFQ